jgi:hypothetical protein
VAGCCEYGDEPSGSGTTELIYWINKNKEKNSYFEPNVKHLVSASTLDTGAMYLSLISVLKDRYTLRPALYLGKEAKRLSGYTV